MVPCRCMYTPQPHTEAYLPEHAGHKVYYAQYGNPAGPAIISCHGGPGSKSKAKHAANYDLEHYRVILFDQRGCGQSEPLGEVSNNTTQELVSDMERIREALGIEQWFVGGGSWGSTLALVYAQTHPKRVRGLVLSALFLGDERGDRWSFTDPGGVARLFPDGRAELEHALHTLGIDPGYEDMPAALLQRLREGAEIEQWQVVALINNWEANLLAPHIEQKFIRPDEVDEAMVASVRVFLHYQAHSYFLKPDQIMEQIETISHMPTCLVHGRYDILCPLESAWRLHRALPLSRLVILPQSAHALSGDSAVARYYAFAHFLQAN